MTTGAARWPLRGGLLASLRSAVDVRVAVTVIYLVLIGLIGFAHQAPAAGTIGGAAVGTVLPDGSVADLCQRPLPGDDRVRGGPALCDACLITAAPGLPPVEAPLPVVPGSSLSAPMPPVVVLARSAPSHGFRGRGPPSIRLVA